jgi:hypothetical protein
MIGRLDFRSRRAGKQPRAAWYLRYYRIIKRKRVAYARAQACSTLQHAQRQIGRFRELAESHRVPIDKMDELPAIPPVPGKEWVEHLQGLENLRPPVMAKAEPAPQPAPQNTLGVLRFAEPWATNA